MEGGPINSYTEDDYTTPLVARGTTISTTQKLYLIIYFSILFIYLCGAQTASRSSDDSATSSSPDAPWLSYAP